jgi:hypothetical protein
MDDTLLLADIEMTGADSTYSRSSAGKTKIKIIQLCSLYSASIMYAEEFVDDVC